MYTRQKWLFSTTLMLLASSLESTFAQWSNDPTVNTPICTAAADQQYPTIVSDGVGGAIIAWEDSQSSRYDIYAQRVNNAGAVQWTTNGVPICVAANDQFHPKIISDGTRGAIITWMDYRSGTKWNIYAQKINGAGAVQWTTDGVPVCVAGNDQNPSDYSTITNDGAGGAIITWMDYRSGMNDDIYAQRINAAGAVQWTTNGVPISTAANNQDYPTITSDSAGGAILTWFDYRSGTIPHIYAQRINAAGAVQWTTNGVPICVDPNGQISPTITSDGAGGAIISWEDGRSGTNDDIYAQRINAAGAVQWTTNGVPISTAANNQDYLTIVSDGVGGAIITWMDGRSGANDDIYAQRINAAGAVQWTTNGVPISIAAKDQIYPTITNDGTEGAIITWMDGRSGKNDDIYAQRINAAGAVEWTTNGVPISTAAKDRIYPTITSDGAGGAIITWNDTRGTTGYDVYAQRVDSAGHLGITTGIGEKIANAPIGYVLEQNYPNPFNPATTISFSLPSKSFVSLKVFDALGREVSILLRGELPAGTYARQWNAPALPSGVYFYRVVADAIPSGQVGSFTETKKLLLLR